MRLGTGLGRIFDRIVRLPNVRGYEMSRSSSDEDNEQCFLNVLDASSSIVPSCGPVTSL